MKTNEILSQIFGYASIICWVVVGFPQFVANYRNKSAKSLSISFLLIWLIGDFFNVVGCVLSKLQRSLLFVGVWYTLMDIVLIYQFFWYDRWKCGLGSAVGQQPLQADEESQQGSQTISPIPYQRANLSRDTPALGPRSYFTPACIPNSSDVSFLHTENKLMLGTPDPELLHSRRQVRVARIAHDEELPTQPSGIFIHHSDPAGLQATRPLMAIVLFVFGTFSFGGSSIAPVHKQTSRVLLTDSSSEELYFKIGYYFGWVTAVFYIVSRWPQIFKTYQRKSCEGLSVGMFVCSVLGNLTYAASIFALSVEATFLMDKLPWIISALGTLIFDFAIFLQFYYYTSKASHYTAL